MTLSTFKDQGCGIWANGSRGSFGLNTSDTIGFAGPLESGLRAEDEEAIREGRSEA